MSTENTNKGDLFGSEFLEPAVTPKVDTETKTETPAQFRREIDLGDGSGKQVFEADSADGLIDKLTEAQTNATKKIQELSRVDRPVRVRPETDFHVPHAAKELTADEIFEIQTGSFDPKNVLNKLLKAQFGVDTDTVAGKFELERQETAQREFLANNKEFVPNSANAKLITDFLDKEKLPLTKRNLDYAFQELKADGLFTPAQNQTTQTPRIEEKPNNNETKTEVKEEKKRSTGVPDIGGSRSEAATEGDNADVEAEVREIYAMTDLEAARTRMQRLLAKVNKK